jgi:hypothetical protein
MTKTEMFPDTSVYPPFNHLTPLLAQVYFIEFRRSEEFKLHKLGEN